MSNSDKLLAILELTAKKLNPPHKKDTKQIVINGIEKVDFKKLNPHLRYLRGYEWVNAKNITRWQKDGIDGWEPTRLMGMDSVNSIVKIDDITIAVAKADSVYLVDLLSSECIKELTHGSSVSSLTVLADNSIVSGGYDGKLIIWQLQNGKYEKLSELKHGNGWVNSIAVLADNSIVSGGYDGKLIIWQLQNGKYEKLSELKHGNGWLGPLAILADNSIVSGGYDGKLIIWQLQNGKYEKLSELTHGSWISSIAILADNSIVSAGNNGSLIIWQLQNGKYEKLSELKHGNGWLGSLAVLADNSIVSRSKDGKLIIWQLQDGKYEKLFELIHESNAYSLAVLSDSKIVSGGTNGEIVVHDLKNTNNQTIPHNTEDEEIYKIYKNGKWRIGRTKGEWHYGDDELMYKYGWFTNGSRCVPYYCFDEAEVMEYFLDERALPID